MCFGILLAQTLGERISMISDQAKVCFDNMN